MAGAITQAHSGTVARVTLANPGKHNAIDVAMWRDLRVAFEQLQRLPAADAPLDGSPGAAPVTVLFTA